MSPSDTVQLTISADTTLGYYDPTKEIVLQANDSTTGLGATLLQDQKPIAFASKTLTDTESRYANFERELLAVVYECERFHTYLFGRRFVAESDHKPLESIQRKNSKATKNASPIIAIRCHHQIPSRQPNVCDRCPFKALL